MSYVTSRDGTTIAYDRFGNGPALILVDGALCSRGCGPSPKLRRCWRAHFASIAVPVLMMNGSKTDGRLRTATIKPEVLAPAVAEFLAASAEPIGSGHSRKP
jgi:hypothetical protein